ncbi:MAG: SDR family oxidoreductase [Planctomycetales bacterium]
MITGHMGYVGSVLAPMLIGDGHRVVGLDMGFFQEGVLGETPRGIPHWDMDVRDVTTDQLHGIDVVIHLAGISSDPLGDLNPAVTFDINHRASVRLAVLARAAGVRQFMFASSCDVYGGNDGQVPLTEDAALNPLTPFARSKALAEQDISDLADDNFSPSYFRCATAYGYSPRMRTDLLVNYLCGSAILKDEVHLDSDGSEFRPLVHVEDIARSYCSVLNSPLDLTHNQVYNVGRTAENYPLRTVAEIVNAGVPGSTIHSEPSTGGDVRGYSVDCSKLESTIKTYRPIWDVETGIRQLFSIYRHFGLTCDQFLGRPFMRLDQIKWLIANGKLGVSLRSQNVA